MESKKKNLDPESFAFDIDGVVADTMGTFIKIARDEYGIDHLSKDQITSYWLEKCLPMAEEIVWAIVERIIKDPFGVGLQPIPGARDGLLAFANNSRALTFVTARPEKDGIESWLRSILNCVNPEKINVIATGEHGKKADVLKQHGFSYFVEDNLETCAHLCQEGIGAIVFDQPWNRHYTPYERVYSWDDILMLTGLDKNNPGHHGNKIRNPRK